MKRYEYIDNTASDGEPVSIRFHAAIMDAIRNDGHLPDELADLISLTRNPKGSAAEWSINWA